MIAQTLGACRVLDKLGEGGMGEVYRAHDPLHVGDLDDDFASAVRAAKATDSPELGKVFPRPA